MAHFEDPPDKVGAEARAAIKLAETEPGRWVFVREHTSQAVANATGWKLKERVGHDKIQTRTAGGKLFLRMIAKETK